jgi:thiosulfate reductase cytochrome b subunit
VSVVSQAGIGPAKARAARPVRPTKVLVKRHSLIVRITHWINAISLLLLLLSGLQIFNAHPALYWGQQADFSHPWLAMGPKVVGGHLHGVTRLGPASFDTTGVLGVSKVNGAEAVRGFPAWITLPAEQYLAVGRRWHFFWAWVFAINGAIYAASALLSGHLKRDLLPTGGQLKPSHVLKEIWDHARLRFPRGEEARHYNVLQKGAYAGTAFILLPLMILTGMTMSPGLDATFPWLLDLFGGRQSARSIHFITASLIVAFFLVHIAMVVLSGTWNNVRSMITGSYAIEVAAPVPVAPPAETPVVETPPVETVAPEPPPAPVEAAPAAPPAAPEISTTAEGAVKPDARPGEAP